MFLSIDGVLILCVFGIFWAILFYKLFKLATLLASMIGLIKVILFLVRVKYLKPEHLRNLFGYSLRYSVTLRPIAEGEGLVA